jgi:hypothetical protein
LRPWFPAHSAESKPPPYQTRPAKPGSTDEPALVECRNEESAL